MSNTLTAFVHTLRFEANDVISVELRPAPGVVFPPFEAGSHIDLHLPNGMVRNYSLLNAQGEEGRYVIGVLRDRASRGGSRCVHQDLRVGMTLPISAPRNNFQLHEDAGHSVLVAGGIGVTPILGMARRLKALGKPFELLYFARSRASAAFIAELEALGVPAYWHFDDERGAPPDLKALLAYSTVSQLGWIIALIGLGNSAGLAVAALHTFAHALFKRLTASNQLSQAQTTARHFVFIGRANAAPCRADFGITTMNLTRLIECDMTLQN